MANDFTDFVPVKTLPRDDYENQVGADDPFERPDVINRAALGLQAAIKRLLNTLFDGATLDLTDQTTVTAFTDMLFKPGKLPVLAKTANYTVTTADVRRLIDATANTWTLTLPAAATAGDGFWFAVRNSGSGVITIDPDGTETIDGAATIALEAGASALVVCSGTLWRTIGRTSAETGTWGSDLAGGTRVAGTNYQNTSGKKRRVIVGVTGAGGAGGKSWQVYVGSANPATIAIAEIVENGTTGGRDNVSFEVPNNWYYRTAVNTGTLYSWYELDE